VGANHPHYYTASPTKTASRQGTSQQQKEKKENSGWDNWAPERIRERRCSVGNYEESDSEGEVDNNDQKGRVVENLDGEMQVMRRVFGKWARLAGLKSKVADELKAGEFEVDWTRAIAPRIEGRIVRVDGGPE
ncbi:hypothetical protein F4808DRAFT_466461, partial [Astrocystis sublimbata]